MDGAKVRHRRLDRVSSVIVSVVLVAMASGCAPEKRAVGPTPPHTPPNGQDDPRAARIEANAFEVSEGGRQFRWAGCGQCHGNDAVGAARLDDPAWRCGGATTRIYVSIAEGCGVGMPAYGARLTSEQIWRLAAYVRSLPKTDPQKRRRGDNALGGEPDGQQWKGPLT
jgi:cytochrome c oxidase cbb3-type subunit 3